MDRGDQFPNLYHVDIGENIQLSFVERLKNTEAKYQFVKDEMELIFFIPRLIRGISTMKVLV